MIRASNNTFSCTPAVVTSSVALPVKTLVTYTSSTIFTIPQDKKIVSVIVGEIRNLNATKYTYNPALSTNNFEITDTAFISDIEAGEKIEITTI